MIGLGSYAPSDALGLAKACPSSNDFSRILYGICSVLQLPPGFSDVPTGVLAI
jgi:hypothetical protein